MNRTVGCLMVLFLISFWGMAQGGEVIKIGTSMDLSGYYGEVGKKLLEGYTLAFKEINASGGIKGREIEHVVYDDGYNVGRAMENVSKLCLKDKVSLLFAVFGTPPNVSLMSRLSVLKVPHFFPISGGSFLYSEVNPYLFTFLPSYKKESQSLVDLAYKEGHKGLGVLYLPNAYGWDCKIAAKREAKRLGMGVVTYRLKSERDVSSLAKRLASQKIEALYLVIPYKFLLPLLKAMDAEGYHPALYAEFYCRLPQAMAKLKERAKLFSEAAWGRFIPMLGEDYPAIGWYRDALQRFAPDQSPDPTVFMGYIMGRTLGEVLKRAPSLDPKGIIKGAESVKDLDVGLSEKISYSPTDHVGLSRVFLYHLSP